MYNKVHSSRSKKCGIWDVTSQKWAGSSHWNRHRKKENRYWKYHQEWFEGWVVLYNVCITLIIYSSNSFSFLRTSNLCLCLLFKERGEEETQKMNFVYTKILFSWSISHFSTLNWTVSLLFSILSCHCKWMSWGESGQENNKNIERNDETHAK